MVPAKGDLRQYCKQLPKLELHVHLETTLETHVLETLAHRYDVPAPVALTDDGRGVQTFFDRWRQIQQCIVSVDDYALVAESCARRMQGDGSIYAEVMFSASAVLEKGLSLLDVIQAITDVFCGQDGIRFKLIADITRDFGVHHAQRVLKELFKSKSTLLVGIDLGGSEHQFPAKSFAPIFDQARENGFQCAAHAGEFAGPQSIWDALKFLHVSRIGHGLTAVQDTKLLNYLSDHQICIDACVGSNYFTKRINRHDEYPLYIYQAAGIPLSVNTDDPIIFGKNLSDELFAVADAFKLDEAALLNLQLEALQYAWLNHDERSALRAVLERPI